MTAPSPATTPAPAGKGAVVLPFIIVTLIWSSTWIVIRDQNSAVPPGWSVAYRFLLAAIGMFIVARTMKVKLWPGWSGIGFATLVGATQFVLNFNFVYRAELYLTSGLVAVFYALLLVPNTALSWALFRQPVSRRFLLGSAIAISGVALLFLHEFRISAIDPGSVALGLAFTSAGLMSASVANILQATPVARRLPMQSLLAWAMLIGGTADAAFAWATSGPPVMDMRPTYILGTAYLALVGSVATFPLYFGLIQRIGAGRAAYSGVAIPVIAMLLSTLFEGYRWSLLAAIGGLLAITGMIVALVARI